MANSWLRLWHDMPNDPKWRSISRASKQPISLVLSVYVHVLVNASNADERGRTKNLNSEDLASALDVDIEQVDAVLAAMQGRVLDGDAVTGWGKRQPIREDGAAERAKAWREAKKAQQERSQTQPNASESQDADKDTDKELIVSKDTLSTAKLPTCPHLAIIDLFAKHLPELPQPKAELWDGARAKNLAARWKWVLTEKRRSTGTPHAGNKEEALAWFDRFFGYVAQSDFLTGRDGKWQNCDLAWLTKADNFAKVLQGNYENKG